MKAMVLAAGLGTRLKPLTETKPKALIEVNGEALLQIVLTKLISFGVTDVIINLHHFPEQIIDFLNKKDHFGIRVAFSHEDTLLDTGGGLKKAAPFFDDEEPFIVHNVDIVSDIDLRDMVKKHDCTKALATLAVNQRTSTRYFIFDEHDLLCGWRSSTTGEQILSRQPEGQVTERAFCGIHVISPRIFEKLSEDGAFSIVGSYLRLAGEGEHILAFRADRFSYCDFGKLDQIEKLRSRK